MRMCAEGGGRTLGSAPYQPTPNCDQGVEVKYVYSMSVLRRGRTGSQNCRSCFSLKTESEWPSQNELGKPTYIANNSSVHSHTTLLSQQTLARQHRQCHRRLRPALRSGCI